ncbi:TPR end-of-group domain-containing protein [Geodermatophilus dictyosporus]|uniref:TPR end-of-group domain-containing protein n=1 Tax=Geodermatophilus dictyosporus TaxID=1523247 RepID=UPI0010AAC9E6|nr:hypothetical protein [Geodermatophilus dictyosporus]
MELGEREATRGWGVLVLAALALIVEASALCLDSLTPWQRVGASLAVLGAALVAASREWTRRWLRILGAAGLLLLLLTVADIGRTYLAAETGSEALEEIADLRSITENLSAREQELEEQAEDSRTAALETLAAHINIATVRTEALDAARLLPDLLAEGGDPEARRAALDAFDEAYVANQASEFDERLRAAVDVAAQAAARADVDPDRTAADSALSEACITASESAQISRPIACNGDPSTVQLGVALAAARLAVAEYRQDLLGRDLDAAAVTEAESALTDALASASGTDEPSADLVDAIEAGADTLVGSYELGAIAWIALGGAALLGWRHLEVRSTRQMPGPVEPKLETATAPNTDESTVDQNAVFRTALLKNVSVPAAAPGATHAAAVTDLAQLADTVAPSWLKPLITVVGSALSTQGGYRADADVVASATANKGTEMKQDEEEPAWRVLVRLTDLTTGQQVAVRELTGKDAATACRAAGYWAAGTILARSPRVPSWSHWSGDTANALAAADDAKEGDCTTLKGAVALAPTSGLLLVKLAFEYDIAGQHAEALAHYARAVAVHPRYLVARYRLAASLGLQAGDATETWFQRSTSERRRITEELRRARQTLGLTDQRRVEELVRAPRTVGPSSPTSEAFQELARQHYREIVRSTPWWSGYGYLTGMARRSERELWKEVFRGDNFARRIHWTAKSAALVNEVAIESQRRKPATEDLSAVLGWARHPRSSWQVSYNLGCYYARQGLTEDALSWLEIARSRPGAEQMNERWLGKDPDLVNVAQHPRFISLRRSLTSVEDVRD